ncbi:tRNA (adenosine(37)-N6)-threonylcarbamoyltransferase complex dimerization subunit type 1 TsaB [Pigmentiphaga aceris]|uniref:tRNA (Adenosine(37)-N6)-threonylcarbamoyltransferase complex dimerization subunit type 1 TsaB n=1 Tax=Pigmentiphaga aceris TaxID=1940612 RepID=A0A5C0B082_9BURK|nr:tRNA (adenosine(37)-N6)-threonylcarbamoyltransferase complex dimerization subunit type 1 TsaB [Pigmentiphaga aceris]QEI06251.1 tRNA (adenosine(37)-N6)-threonylcarbamoyltransferase complex dimerization subunit type 1 TsaB [Pigmentiphaga aceris]
MTQYILALETSGACCGVALLCDASGAQRVVLREHHGTKEHSERLLPMVDEVLAEAGIAATALSAIAFGQGPGGFTGLRVACGVAQGLGFALELPLAPVVSLAALALASEATTGQVVLVAMDARMDEVYAGAYRIVDDAGWRDVVALDGPILLGAADLLTWARMQSWWTDAVLHVGDAALAYPTQVGLSDTAPRSEIVRPTADAVALLAAGMLRRGECVPADQASPLYVRDKVAFTTAERASGLGGNPRVTLPQVGVANGVAG